MLQLPHCLDNQLIHDIDGGKVASTKHRPRSTPRAVIFLFVVLRSIGS
jgi:hypothetical protein